MEPVTQERMNDLANKHPEEFLRINKAFCASEDALSSFIKKLQEDGLKPGEIGAVAGVMASTVFSVTLGVSLAQAGVSRKVKSAVEREIKKIFK